MRSEFEKLPKISEMLDRNGGGYYRELTKDYHHNYPYFEKFLNGAWSMYQHQQSKVDELQKKNAWLSDVAERENKRANKLQEEKVSTTTLLGKTIQEKNELQKRVDKAIRLLVEAELYQSEPNIDLAVQALKGGE